MPWTAAPPAPTAPTFTSVSAPCAAAKSGSAISSSAEAAYPCQRVSLDIGAAPDGGTGTWAGLTAGEARQLAAALLRHAAACDTHPPDAGPADEVTLRPVITYP